MLRANQPENICEKKTAALPPLYTQQADFTPAAWVRSSPHPLGARLQRRVTPMVSPSWGQSMKFKVRAPPDRFMWYSLASGEAERSVAADLFTTDGD